MGDYKMRKLVLLITAISMIVMLAACGGVEDLSEATDSYDERNTVSSDESMNVTTAPETTTVTTAPETTPVTTAPETTPVTEAGDGLRPEFKAAMDSYEAFYDSYCEIITKYKANPSDLSILTEYSSMLVKMAEMQKAFDEWNSEDLNKEELAYYLEVSNRITQKLLKVS